MLSLSRVYLSKGAFATGELYEKKKSLESGRYHGSRSADCQYGRWGDRQGVCERDKDRRVCGQRNREGKGFTPVLLLDKDGKPVIGPDGKPVYVTPTPAKEADEKSVPDASGAESKEDASGVLADEGQPGSEQEASGMSEGTAALPVGEVVAVPVPVPEETESAGIP